MTRFLHCILSFLSNEAVDVLFPQLSKCFPLGHNLFLFCIFINSIFRTQREQETHRSQLERNHSNLTYPHGFFLHSQKLPISPCLRSLASLKNSHDPQISSSNILPLGISRKLSGSMTLQDPSKSPIYWHNIKVLFQMDYFGKFYKLQDAMCMAMSSQDSLITGLRRIILVFITPQANLCSNLGS